MMNLRSGVPPGTFLMSYYDFTPLLASLSWMESVWVHKKMGTSPWPELLQTEQTISYIFTRASNLLHPSKAAVKKTQIWWMKRRRWAIPCFFFSPLLLRQNHIICIHARTHSLPHTHTPLSPASPFPKSRCWSLQLSSCVSGHLSRWFESLQTRHCSDARHGGCAHVRAYTSTPSSTDVTPSIVISRERTCFSVCVP